MTAHDGRVGADRGTALNARRAKLAFAINGGARIDHVGEDDRRSAKHVVLKGHALVNADVVLDFATVAADDARSYHDILSEHAIRVDASSRENVAEVPDTGVPPPIRAPSSIQALSWIIASGRSPTATVRFSVAQYAPPSLDTPARRRGRFRRLNSANAPSEVFIGRMINEN